MRDYEKLSRAHFNGQAAQYDANNTYYYSDPAKISCHDTAQRLRDVGCGTGYLLALLADQKPAEYHGLDLSDEMVRVAQEKNIAGAVLVQGSADRLPYEDASFDVVTCIQSFHHYPHPDKAMRKAWRVLKPGGLYLISDTGIGGIGGWIDNKLIFPLLKSGDARAENRHGIARGMRRNGFEVVEGRRIKGFIYTVAGKKPG